MFMKANANPKDNENRGIHDSLKGGPIGRNSVVKIRKIFLNAMQKILSKNSLPLPRNR